MLGRLRLSRAPVAVRPGLVRRIHTSTPLRAVAPGAPQANRSVVAAAAFAQAIEEASSRGDHTTMLRLGAAFNRARLKTTVPILNSVIGAFARADDRTNTFKYFFSMKELRLDPNADSFNAILAMWARYGDLQNMLRWLRAMRRNQTLPNRETVRICRQAFMVRGKMKNEFLYLKDAKVLKRLMSITPDVIAQVKSTHASNVLERSQRRARWLTEADAIDGITRKVVATDAGTADAAAAAAAAAEAAAASEVTAATSAPGKDGKVSKAEKKAKADKAAAAKAASAAQEAERAALSKVRSNPKWERIIRAVELLHPNNNAQAVGIPDATDSVQNQSRLEKRRKRETNPETLAAAAQRAFVEMTRPVHTRRAAIDITNAERRAERDAKHDEAVAKHEVMLVEHQKIKASRATATA